MAIRYVNKNTTCLYENSTNNKTKLHLLWGDRVKTQNNPNNTAERIKVKARGKEGFIKKSDIGTKSLLEIYFIDVGQGDGILICTPNRRHILIDGGYRRKFLPTGKNAADFVDWKFYKDYEEDTIVIDDMIVSHCDADHYGGLWDLIDPNETHELDAPNVKVKNFYHAGVSWWKNGNSKRSLGPKKNGKLTLLLEDRNNVIQALAGLPSGYRLQGYWAQFMENVVDVCNNMSRLSNKIGYLPNYAPNDNSNVKIKVLGPIEDTYGNSPALKSLGGTSKNTNGHSVLLSLNYGRTRILLTGDLNKKSQRYLLDNTIGQHQEFACDVAKGCHHGSEDISYEFLSHMSAAATIISSGDNEGHSHPRPNVVSASSLTGHIKIENDELATPLIYSTEIARSVRFGKPYEIIAKNYPIGNNNQIDVKLTKDHNPSIKYTEKAAGDLQARHRSRRFSNLYVVGGIRYGLVNVRTDGNKILCATLSEKDNTWDIKTFESRF